MQPQQPSPPPPIVPPSPAASGPTPHAATAVATPTPTAKGEGVWDNFMERATTTPTGALGASFKNGGKKAASASHIDAPSVDPSAVEEKPTIGEVCSAVTGLMMLHL